jgi:hypothetical protein
VKEHEMTTWDVSVSRSFLVSQARFWGDVCPKPLEWSSEQASESEWHSSAGIYGQVIPPYNQVCEMMARLCMQGATQMAAISDALVRAYRNYDSTESENTSLAQRIHL